jgi:hypothetical protein
MRVSRSLRRASVPRAACDALIAIEFAHARRKFLRRYRAEADDQRLVPSFRLRCDKCADRLGRAPGEEVADIFA